MPMNSEAIRKMIDSKPPDVDLADWMASEGARMESVRQGVSRLTARISALEEKHRSEMAAVRREVDGAVSELQGLCRHHEVAHHGDPSGGTDSFSVCETCRKEF